MQKTNDWIRLSLQYFAEDAASEEQAEGVNSDETLLEDLAEEEEPEADEIAIAEENFGGDEDEWLAFVREHPDVTELPADVIRRVAAGEPLRYAYAMAENERLRCRLAVYEQNAQLAAKSPGSMLSEDGDDGVDPFLQGLFG